MNREHAENAFTAAYVRVSSRSQNHATQRDAISKAAKARGDRIAHWFEEKRTGAKLARPELDRVRKLVAAGEIHKLYVFRIDRLTRSGIRDTLSVLEELRAGGCKVISLEDGFALEGSSAEVVIAVMAWAASMERLALGERISAARARVEAAGGRWGRPASVDGHCRRMIERFAGQDRSIRWISAAVKVPRSTVAAVLSEKGPYKRAPKGAAKKPARKR